MNFYSLLLISTLALSFLGCNKPVDNLLSDMEGELVYLNLQDARVSELIRVKPDGTESIVVLKEVNENGSAYIEKSGSNWSNDKTKILYTSAPGTYTGLADIFIINKDGSGLRNITNTPNKHESSARLSPDGTTIAFAMGDQNNTNVQLYLMDIDGKNIRQLTNFPDEHRFYPSGPMWMPDGKTLLFIVNEDHLTNNLYSIQVDGANHKKLTSNINTSIVSYSMTKDGRTIAYMSIIDQMCHLYTISTDGKNKKEIAKVFKAFDLAISPNGRYIAYVGDKYNTSIGIGEDIWVMRIDGTNVTKITDTNGSKSSLDWK